MELCTYCTEAEAEGYINGKKDMPVCNDCYENYHGEID